MRPINKGEWPLTPTRGRRMVFNDWTRAIPILRERTGWYCHLCEMRVTNALAIEHIKPQEHFPKLKNHWNNFLLICNSCNSHKKDTIPKPPYRKRYYWPHLDNTLMIFEYGRSWPSIKPSSKLDKRQQARANALIELYGLNKEVKSNGESDSRWIQKCKALKDAIDCRIDFEKGCISIDAILRTATLSGFFSIWYAIFKDVPSIRTALIEKPDFHILETNCVDEFGNLKERHSENT